MEKNIDFYLDQKEKYEKIRYENLRAKEDF
jgi:hypothetical protein